MGSSIRKEAKNFLAFYYLARFDKRIPTDKKKAAKRQGKRIYSMMKRAYEIPFYRERFDRCGLLPSDFRSAEDLTKFPILTRQELREWMDEEIAAAEAQGKDWNVYSTSGSSGVPLRFILTDREEACVTANWVRVTMFAGYHPFTQKMLSYQKKYTGKQTKASDSFIQKLGILRRRVVAEELYADGGLGELVEQINEYKPDLICFRKNLLIRIADYVQKNGMSLHKPALFFPISEMVDEVARRILLKTFGPGLVDAYGCEELASCAVKLPGAETFYTYMDTHVLNVVDARGKLAENGTIVGSTLYKRDFPFINYEIGDQAVACFVDGVQEIKSISGRSNDLVLHADGTQSASTGLRKVADGCLAISQFRYVQTSVNTLRVVLVMSSSSTMNTGEVEAYFLDGIHELFGEEFNISFEWLTVIPPDKNGKMRCFVRDIQE